MNQEPDASVAYRQSSVGENSCVEFGGVFLLWSSVPGAMRWMQSRKVTDELTGNPMKDNWFAQECARTPLDVAQDLLRFVPTISA
jgi:hypothetical protein